MPESIETAAQPPSCNTGVHPPLKSPLVGVPFALQSRFDWYRATVPAHPDLITGWVLRHSDRATVVDEPDRGRFNYRSTRTIVDHRGDRIVTILHGGPNGHPNVEASNERAVMLSDVLRSAGPHRVTRCDVAWDVYGPQAFRRLRRIGYQVAKKHGLNTDPRGDKLKPEKGFTLNIGSRSSTVYLRIYEKGKKDGHLYSDCPAEVIHHWVRCELEVKPAKEMKSLAAELEPSSFWGVSDWTADFTRKAFDMAPQPIPFHPRRTASDDRAFATMCTQYRDVMRRRCAQVHNGDRLALAQEILARIYDEDSEQAA